MSYKIVFSVQAKEDIQAHQRAGNQAVLNKIEQLILSIINTPFEGIGKPEPLKHNLAGCWSHRINVEHRLVYEVKTEENQVHILSAKGHYQ